MASSSPIFAMSVCRIGFNIVVRFDVRCVVWGVMQRYTFKKITIRRMRHDTSSSANQKAHSISDSALQV